MKQAPRRSRWCRDDRGATSLVQTVFVAPALLFALMLIPQAALYFHAKDVAQAAAQQGASVARSFNGNTAAAQARTNQYLTALAGKLFSKSNITVNRTATTASVEVTGTVVNVVPFLHWSVDETATGPVERYVPPVSQP